MAKIEAYELISGRDIKYENICTLHPPTLSSIWDIGFPKYNNYLTILAMNLDKYIEIMNLQETIERIDEQMRKECTIFDFLIAEQSTRELLSEALCFFIAEKIEYDPINRWFSILDNNEAPVAHIDRSNYENIKYGIQQCNFIDDQNIKPKKCGSVTKGILKKLAKGREEMAKTKKDKNMNLIDNIDYKL